MPNREWFETKRIGALLFAFEAFSDDDGDDDVDDNGELEEEEAKLSDARNSPR